MSWINATTARALSKLAVVAALAWPTTAAAAPLPVLPGYQFGGLTVGTTYPGDMFDWPDPIFSGYSWFVDVTGVMSAPTTALDFVVTNGMPFPLQVQTFQVFSNCGFGANPPWTPGFSLFINEVPTAWSAVTTSPCDYHDFIDFMLEPGDTRFRVVLDNEPEPFTPNVDVRFGDVMPAVPLPATGMSLLAGLAALAVMRRRRSTV